MTEGFTARTYAAVTKVHLGLYRGAVLLEVEQPVELLFH